MRERGRRRFGGDAMKDVGLGNIREIYHDATTARVMGYEYRLMAGR
jgi:hypothetical protein